MPGLLPLLQCFEVAVWQFCSVLHKLKGCPSYPATPRRGLQPSILQLPWPSCISRLGRVCIPPMRSSQYLALLPLRHSLEAKRSSAMNSVSYDLRNILITTFSDL